MASLGHGEVPACLMSIHYITLYHSLLGCMTPAIKHDFGNFCNSLFNSPSHIAFAGTSLINTLRPRQDGRHFPDDIFICIFLNENEWHSIKISLKFVPKVPINNIPALVQIMAWRRPGDKPLSEPMMVVLPTHICITRPQWVNRD